jgi:hypothetical protein
MHQFAEVRLLAARDDRIDYRNSNAASHIAQQVVNPPVAFPSSSFLKYETEIVENGTKTQPNPKPLITM